MAKKTTRIRRSFTPQFKRDAVRLVEEGRSVTEVAHDLGIARSLLVRWKTQLAQEAEGTFVGKSRPVADTEELKELRKKLRDVTEERDILKKALAYFADDQK